MKTEWIITIAGAIIGALAGWLYWKYVGCASGACVITSKPLNSTLYGALLGALLFNTVAPSITQRNSQTKTEKHDNND
jgi:hypothetical protein